MAFEGNMAAGYSPIESGIKTIQATIRGDGLMEIALKGKDLKHALEQIAILESLKKEMAEANRLSKMRLAQGKRNPNRNAQGEGP